MATFYVGNLEFKASTNELKGELDEVFHKIHVEDVVIPRMEGRSHSYAFVTLSWAKASNISKFYMCKFYSGELFVNSADISQWARQQG